LAAPVLSCPKIRAKPLKQLHGAERHAIGSVFDISPERAKDIFSPEF
jgi:hypothetical protein